MKYAIIVISTLFSFYILFCILLYLRQEKLLFFPSSIDMDHYTALEKDPSLDNIQLTTSDGEILDGWIQKIEDPKYVLLYFWWNADETSYFVQDTFYSGVQIVSFNYRGYARSTGKPGEKEFLNDAILQYDYLINTLKIPPEEIIVMGRSLGSGIATYLASERMVAKVILITPYDSMESLAQENYPIVPVSLLLKHKFLASQYASKKMNTLLCIFAGRDTVIPNVHTENLLKAWKGKIEKVFVPKADHNTIYQFKEVDEAIGQFLEKP